MPTYAALLRAVNLGGKSRLPMSDLRDICMELGLRDPVTYIQSGNVIFEAEAAQLRELPSRMTAAIEQRFGFRTEVILRSAAELRDVIRRNPFAERAASDPAKLLVVFLASDPGEESRAKLRSIDTEKEELHPSGAELYIWYPEGMGRSRLTNATLERACTTTGTARNWNTVERLCALAEARGGVTERRSNTEPTASARTSARGRSPASPSSRRRS